MQQSNSVYDLFLLFQGRPWQVQILTLFVGQVITVAVYLVVLLEQGEADLLTSNTQSAIEARQSALTVAIVVAGMYYAFCYIYALGGPVFNTLCVAISAVGPPITLGIAFGALPELTITRSREAGFLVEVMRMFLPGALIHFATLIGGSWILGPTGEEAEQWKRTHLPDQYREREEPPNHDVIDTADINTTDSMWKRVIIVSLSLLVGGYLLRLGILAFVLPAVGNPGGFSAGTFLLLAWLLVWAGGTVWYAIRATRRAS